MSTAAASPATLTPSKCERMNQRTRNARPAAEKACLDIYNDELSETGTTSGRLPPCSKETKGCSAEWAAQPQSKQRTKRELVASSLSLERAFAVGHALRSAARASQHVELPSRHGELTLIPADDELHGVEPQWSAAGGPRVAERAAPFADGSRRPTDVAAAALPRRQLSSTDRAAAVSSTHGAAAAARGARTAARRRHPRTAALAAARGDRKRDDWAGGRQPAPSPTAARRPATGPLRVLAKGPGGEPCAARVETRAAESAHGVQWYARRSASRSTAAPGFYARPRAPRQLQELPDSSSSGSSRQHLPDATLVRRC